VDEGGKMKILDLFSGIGGFALAGRMAGLPDPVMFCEVDQD
jgi:site-specific DNA-cytosine methylase